MYFAILGKNPEISKAELELVQPTNISYPKKGVIVFDTKYADRLSTLGGIIKAGPVVKERNLPTILVGVSIIGIKEIANGKHLKTTMGIRRFKTVDFFHTDKEIREKGKELINLGEGDYGVVEWYQNIALYESIDFDKPARSMHMGMMPAKLAHIMINIGINEMCGKEPGPASCVLHTAPTIYDPFVGSGTTGFLANYLGYDFMGSDINISYMGKNVQRWEENKGYNKEHAFNIFPHDITKPIDPPALKEAKNILIISEGRLGPIVTSKTSPTEIQQAEKQVLDLYISFLHMIKQLQATTVVTIPYYANTENTIEQKLAGHANKLGLTITSIPEIYQRENQKIGRKILIIQ